MTGRWLPGGRAALGLVLLLSMGMLGCHRGFISEEQGVGITAPRELNKAILPDYIIEPPDILIIDALNVAPKPPYRVAALDVLYINVLGAFPTDPIASLYSVDPEGHVNLGPSYGTVRLIGMTITEAQAAITKHLSSILAAGFKVQVSLAQSRAMQLIRGQHLVTPDGQVRFGVYGTVRVAGMTLVQARQAIEQHLKQYLLKPEVSVDVAAYNSKIIYVIFDGGGNGYQIVRLPVTGNDTVLDAIAQVGGLGAVASNKMWIARPAPAGAPNNQILPIDFDGIIQTGRTATNYQLLPGDRLYVKANPLVTADTFITRIAAPVERIFGVTALANGTVRAFVQQNNNGNGNGIGR
jgi:polysaccharide export outer membrane protein